MPLCEITIIEGRSPEKKRALMKEVTEAIHRSVDAPIETIRVILREVPAAHWAIGGVPKG
jgi:4-oxalocrotonate tautomerase